MHFFHASEVAFWPKAKQGMAAVLQMVPASVDTTVILESTANGVGGAFYDIFQQAVDRVRTTGGLEGYIPVFFPWHKFPEYQRLVPRSFILEQDEREIKTEFSLSDEQIFWRRLKVQELGGDESLFRQEYPASAEQHEVSVVLDQIEVTRADKHRVIAEFYEKTNQPAAARYYYRTITERWPRSPAASQASVITSVSTGSTIVTVRIPKMSPDR